MHQLDDRRSVKDGHMVFGMTLETYTLVHVLTSLVGIGSGIIVLSGMIGSRRLGGMTTLFLWSTVLTSVTGFGFPFVRLLPSHIVGFISLVLLGIAMLALYGSHLRGRWRSIYVVCASAALYLNVFVLVVQGFMKVPALKALAPTQSEPPFQVAQFVVLVLFVLLTILAVKRFPRDEIRTA
jgi:hypothetical protein